MINNNFKRIYYLTDEGTGEFFEQLWGKDVACLTHKEIKELFQDYSAEEIINMEEGRRAAGSHTYPEFDGIIKGLKRENKKVNLYSEYNLPIELTHKLVKAGIRTEIDLLLTSEQEIFNISENDQESYEMIIDELESKKQFLKGAKDSDRLKTIYTLMEQINEEKIVNQRRIEELKEIIEKLKKQISMQINLTSELYEEKQNIIKNSEENKVKTLKHILNK